MRLYLIRHARPEVASGICYGRTDLPVSPEENANVLSALLPMLPLNAPVFSSPLQRCRELAQKIAAAVGSHQVMHDDRLAEIHFGKWEMCAWDDIPHEEVDAWAKNLIEYRPGDGESVLQMARRIQSFYEEIRQNGAENAIVVCHAGTIRLMSRCKHEIPLQESALDAAQAPHQITYGELVILDC